MDTLPQTNDRALYEADEHAWIARQVAALRSGRLHRLDRESLAEYLTDMTKRDRRELQSRFTVLALHLLKLQFQPGRHTPSWNRTIIVQQQKLRRFLAGIPSLAAQRDVLFADVYDDVKDLAASETGLPVAAFPVSPPWTVDAALAFQPPEPPSRPWRRKR